MTQALLIMRKAFCVMALAAGLVLGATLPAQAQEQAQSSQATPVEEGAVRRVGPPPPAAEPPVQDARTATGGFNPLSAVPRGAFREDGSIMPGEDLFSQSLLFTPLEVGALVNMLVRKSRMERDAGPVREGPRRLEDMFAPDGTPLFEDDAGPVVDAPQVEVPAPSYPPIPRQRSVTLSGVLYRAPGDWTVWINGQKVVPSRLLPEIVDIRVERDRVHLKWFDIGLGKVLALSLRPNQTYDIVSSMLLRGERRGTSETPLSPSSPSPSSVPSADAGGAELAPVALDESGAGFGDLGLPPIEPIPHLPEMTIIEGADMLPPVEALP